MARTFNQNFILLSLLFIYIYTILLSIVIFITEKLKTIMPTLIINYFLLFHIFIIYH